MTVPKFPLSPDACSRDRDGRRAFARSGACREPRGLSPTTGRRTAASCMRGAMPRTGHRRVLSLLACDRHAAASVVAHLGGRRRAGICRHRKGAAGRLPGRDGDPRADLSSVISCSASRRNDLPDVSPASRWLLFYYVFMQFAIYRARRYRLTRTVWRGVRFSMTGSGLNYAWRVGLWSRARLRQPRPRAAVAAGRARAVQDALHGLRQSRRAGSTAPAAACSSAAGGLWLAAVGSWRCWSPIVARSTQSTADGWPALLAIVLLLMLLPFVYAMLQGHRMALVGFRHPFRRRANFNPTCARAELIGLYWKVIGWSLLIVPRSGDLVRRRRWASALR